MLICQSSLDWNTVSIHIFYIVHGKYSSQATIKNCANMSPNTSLTHGHFDKKVVSKQSSMLIDLIETTQKSLSITHVTAATYESNTVHSLSQTA